MIVVSGRCLSRAWAAVALAAADDDRPVLSGVRVEEYQEGLRLAATDAYWIAQCWVPAFDALGADGGDAWPNLAPGMVGEDTAEVDMLDGHGLVDDEATVSDSDGRIKDLMAYLRRATGHKDSTDLPVVVDLDARLEEDPSEPSLFPELSLAAARFELPTRERVIAPAVREEYPTWRAMIETAHREQADVESVTAVSEWMLDRLSKATRYVSGASIEFDWRTRGPAGAPRALWRIRGSRLFHAPSGMLAGVRNENGPTDG